MLPQQLKFGKMVITLYVMTSMVLLSRFPIETKKTGNHRLSEIYMNDDTDLQKAFEDKGVNCGGELIIYKEYCGLFVQATKRAGLAVIGIEGFYLLISGDVKPNMEEIADFSGIECNDYCKYVELCSGAATKFIEHMQANGKSDGYSFVLTDWVAYHDTRIYIHTT